MLTPGSKGSPLPALVSLSASVAASVGAGSDVVTLKVVAQYLRRDQSAVAISSHTLPLSTNATQQVPIPVELASCLADAEREQFEGARSTCSVLLNLALAVNDVVVDEQVVGPLRLVPGANAPVSEPVSLFEIAAIDVSVGDGPILSPSEEVTAVLGGTLALNAGIRDRNGQLVADRSVLWSSDAPSIATVGVGSGTVSAIGLGTAHFTASIGSVTRTIALRVTRAPAVLTIAPSVGSGQGIVRSIPTGIECRVSGQTVSGTCAFTFPGDATVLLALTPDNGSTFGLWGDACAGTSVGAICSVTMSQAQTTSVRFSALRRVSIAAVGGDGRGRVLGASGLDCRVDGEQTSGVCVVDLADGASFTLTAAPDASDAGASAQSFGGWGGDCSAALGASCTLVATAANSAVTVRFFDEQQLRLHLAGSGSGRVVWDDGTSCAGNGGTTSGVCARGGVFGAPVTLTAAADQRSVFAGWSGDCEQQAGASCITTLVKGRTVTATFNALRRITIAVKTGDGRGRVTGALGFDCRLDGGRATGSCSADVPDGSSIVLSAVADPPIGAPTARQLFSGWEGSCNLESAGGTACTVIAAGGDRTIFPRFLDARHLTVLLAGNGTGQVVWEDGSVCARAGGATSGVCDQVNVHGSTMRLTAAADPSSSFTGWSGDCAGQFGTGCMTTLTQSRSVTATFTKKRVALTLSLSGAAAGVLTVDGQDACTRTLGQTTTTCVLTFDAGTRVTIEGRASGGARFIGFGGNCSGALSCSIVLSAAVNVTAQFDPQQFLLTLV
ncbi:MAG: hypothetical protein ABI877_12960, partial [Gemmatimonadaceae bacterium]